MALLFLILEKRMTCIAAIVDKETGIIYMGADSAASNYWSMNLIASKKVFRVGEFLIGCSGSLRFMQILRYGLKFPDHPAEMPVEEYINTLLIDAFRGALKQAGNIVKEKELESTTGLLLIGYRKHLFRMQSDYSTLESVDGYDAIGSGADVALGALCATELVSYWPLECYEVSPERRIQHALQAAERHTIGVRAPFSLEILDPGDGAPPEKLVLSEGTIVNGEASKV